jgi:hypothetical protein
MVMGEVIRQKAVEPQGLNGFESAVGAIASFRTLGVGTMQNFCAACKQLLGAVRSCCALTVWPLGVTRKADLSPNRGYTVTAAAKRASLSCRGALDQVSSPTGEMKRAASAPWFAPTCAPKFSAVWNINEV